MINVVLGRASKPSSKTRVIRSWLNAVSTGNWHTTVTLSGRVEKLLSGRGIRKQTLTLQVMIDVTFFFYDFASFLVVVSFASMSDWL